MKKYYISFIADAGQLVEVFKIVDAESIGGAYRELCSTQGAHFHGESPRSDDDAVWMIRESKRCSVNICFLLPDAFQDIQSETIARMFKTMSDKLFGEYFELSREKIVRTGISHQYPELSEKLQKAEKPLPNKGAIVRKFERAFLPNTWFKRKF